MEISQEAYVVCYSVDAESLGEEHISFFFSSRRRHTRCSRDWSQTCALPISRSRRNPGSPGDEPAMGRVVARAAGGQLPALGPADLAELVGDHAAGRPHRARRVPQRSEEHTSELQSPLQLRFPLLL